MGSTFKSGGITPLFFVADISNSVIPEARAISLLAKLVTFCNGVIEPRPARGNASVVDEKGVPGKPKTPFERMKDFAHTCTMKAIFGTDGVELPAPPRHLAGKGKHDMEEEVCLPQTLEGLFCILKVFSLEVKM